ncbi:MAG: hypothetical protein JRI46_03780 [Deltaproteobacteria bacterium]|nr:hypothetical protein [Deltaproteobacteria bacterium]
MTEADTRVKLIDPALHRCGWAEDLIRREETDRGIDVVESEPLRRKRGYLRHENKRNKGRLEQIRRVGKKIYYKKSQETYSNRKD